MAISSQSWNDFKSGVILGCGIFVFFVLVEVILRLAGFYFSTTPRYMEFNFPNKRELHEIFEPDPMTLWRLRPGMSLGPGIEPLNSQGLRGPELDTQNPNGKIRIVALGDSVTFGAQVSYPAELAKCLGDGYEVINAGVPGYSSLQGLRFYDSKIKELKPGIVVAMFGWNDHWLAMGFTDSEQAGNSPSVDVEENPLIDLRLYQIVLWAVLKVTGPGTMEGPLKYRVSLEEYQRNIIALADIVGKTGARTILVTAPSALAMGEIPKNLYKKRFVKRDRGDSEAEAAARLKKLHGQYTDVVRMIGRAPGRAILVDMEKQWDLRGVDDLFNSPGDDVVHPNDTGYRLMAETLCDTIRQIAFERSEK